MVGNIPGCADTDRWQTFRACVSANANIGMHGGSTVGSSKIPVCEDGELRRLGSPRKVHNGIRFV
jgi:hypothetical protein